MDARQIIAHLGGHAALADRLGLNAEATYKWKQRNRIPAHLSFAVLEVAQAIGSPLTLSDLAAQMARPRNKPQVGRI